MGLIYLEHNTDRSAPQTKIRYHREGPFSKGPFLLQFSCGPGPVVYTVTYQCWYLMKRVRVPPGPQQKASAYSWCFLLEKSCPSLPRGRFPNALQNLNVPNKNDHLKSLLPNESKTIRGIYQGSFFHSKKQNKITSQHLSDFYPRGTLER